MSRLIARILTLHRLDLIAGALMLGEYLQSAGQSLKHLENQLGLCHRAVSFEGSRYSIFEIDSLMSYRVTSTDASNLNVLLKICKDYDAHPLDVDQISFSICHLSYWLFLDLSNHHAKFSPPYTLGITHCRCFYKIDSSLKSIPNHGLANSNTDSREASSKKPNNDGQTTY